MIHNHYRDQRACMPIENDSSVHKKKKVKDKYNKNVFSHLVYFTNFTYSEMIQRGLNDQQRSILTRYNY